MEIKSAIGNLQANQDYYNDDMQDGYVGFDKEDNESIDLAVDIMRKYQKIQKIYQWAKDLDGAVKYNWLYEQIGEVLEDGNVD